MRSHRPWLESWPQLQRFSRTGAEDHSTGHARVLTPSGYSSARAPRPASMNGVTRRSRVGNPPEETRPMPRALITGITGQDGLYLSELLLSTRAMRSTA